MSDCDLKCVNFKHNRGIGICRIFVCITLEWMPEGLVDGKVWCRQGTSHYLSECWLRSITWLQWISVARIKEYSWLQICVVIFLTPCKIKYELCVCMHTCLYIHSNLQMPFECDAKIPCSKTMGVMYQGRYSEFQTCGKYTLHIAFPACSFWRSLD